MTSTVSAPLRTPGESAERCRHILDPRSIAVIGASPREGTLHGRIVRNLLDRSFRGAIHPVNPRYASVSGLTCYPTVAAIDQPVDLALVLVGADRVIDAIDDCIAAGIPAALVFASGFAEAGPDGARRQAELHDRLNRIVIGGPNVNCVLSQPASAALGFGPILEFAIDNQPRALISQSGAVGTSIATRAAERGIGFRYAISTGNELDLGIADYLAFLSREADPVRSCLLFVETIRDVERFVDAAQACRGRGIRIIALKVGSSANARAVSATHTAALAGPIELYRALFDKLGVWCVDSLDQLHQCAQFDWWDDRVDGGIVALSFSGGQAALVADQAEISGVPLADLSDETTTRLRELTGATVVTHPFDCSGQVVNNPTQWDGALDAFAAQPHAYGMVAALSAVAGGADDILTGGVVRQRQRGRNIALTWSSGTSERSSVPRLRAERIPVFERVEDGMACLGIRHRALAGIAIGPDEIEAYRASLSSTTTADRRSVQDVMGEYGLRTPAEVVCSDLKDVERAFAAVGGTVVLKAMALLHKSDVGGVVTGLSDAAAVSGAGRRLSAAHGFPLMLQQQVTGTREVLLGCARSELGVAVVIGSGGVLAEVLADTATLLAPFEPAAVVRELEGLHIGRLLRGYRGMAPTDLDRVATAAATLGRYAVARPDIASVDLNPLIVSDDGAELWAVDIKVVMAEEAGG